jgi:hypothetical protein
MSHSDDARLVTGELTMRRGIHWTLIAAASLAACSKAPSPQERHVSAAPSISLPDASANVLRVKQPIGGIETEYAAIFESDRLVRIVEQRQLEATLGSEYEFMGARLLRYRGAKLREPVAVDLEFDAQGALLSKEPEVADDELREIRSRAQLLRSHALARRATMHH